MVAGRTGSDTTNGKPYHLLSGTTSTLTIFSASWYIREKEVQRHPSPVLLHESSRDKRLNVRAMSRSRMEFIVLTGCPHVSYKARGLSPDGC